MSRSWSIPPDSQDSGAAPKGFTLLELLIVCVLLSIMLAVSVPSLRSGLFADPLKRSARQVVGLLREARLLAAGSDTGCLLQVEIESGRFELVCRGSAPIEENLDVSLTAEEQDQEPPALVLDLGEEVRIDSIYNGAGERIAAGAATLWINGRGLMEPAIINLTDGVSVLGLSSSPFSSAVEIADRALEPEEGGS